MSTMTFRLHRWFTFRPSKPRNPLLRLLLGLLGLVVLALLVALGLFVGLAMLLFTAARRLMATTAPVSTAPSQVLEGEYSLVDKPGQPLGLR